MSLFAAAHPWGYLGSPVKRPSYMTQGWANWRSSRGDIHRGADIRAAIGDPAYAAASGTVIIEAYGNPTAGNYIAIEHSGGLVTRYIHLSKIYVKKGQQVSRGQLVGLTGDSAAPGKPHLHFDIEVPVAKIGTHDLLFGRPREGYVESNLGFGPVYKVPVEAMIPIDAMSDLARENAAKSGISLHSGVAMVAGAGLLVAGGVFAWRRLRGRRQLGR